ncbi:MAG: 2-nitropropane dioxygenase-like enzyme [Firmicutes bacterium]|nr:2-nitropropane dioxygenase-like enzyme [Bacillota bacterium]
MKTRITELLGIQYPILCGGMQWLSRAELAAAVSNAGGLGFITAASFCSKEELVSEIRKARTLTDKPIGVNISMLPEVVKGELTLDFIDAVIEEKIPVVETAGRSPDEFLPKFKAAGVKVLHKVTAARFAKKVEGLGVDAVILVGYEAAGHPGLDQVGTFVNLPKTIQELKIPVIAAGGICDGRGLAAALALGADGVLMATRFMATQECIIHQNIKDWMSQAKETDTMIIQRSIRNAFRCVSNDHAHLILGLEQSGATLKELLPYIGGGRGRKAFTEGIMEGAALPMGQCVGLFKDVLTVKEIIDKMIKDAEEISKRVVNIF